MRARWGSFVAVAVAFVGSACSSDGEDLQPALDEANAAVSSLQIELDEARDAFAQATSDSSDIAARVTELEQRLATVERERDDALSGVEDAVGERDDAVDARQTAEGERDTALAAAADADARAADAEARAVAAESARDEIILAFDEQIQARIAEIQAQADSVVCERGAAAGAEGQATAPAVRAALRELLETVPPEVLGGREPIDLVDEAALGARMEECFAVGQQQFLAAEAERHEQERLAALVAPKGDGFWTVGLEIAAGRWRSAGTGDACYWKISPDGNPDDIIDNHFGNAGGTVTLRDGQEFETDDCGQWEFVP